MQYLVFTCKCYLKRQIYNVHAGLPIDIAMKAKGPFIFQS